MVTTRKPPLTIGSEEEDNEPIIPSRPQRGRNGTSVRNAKPNSPPERGTLTYINSPQPKRSKAKEEDEEKELEEEVTSEEGEEEEIRRPGKKQKKGEKTQVSRTVASLDTKSLYIITGITFLSALIAFMLVAQLWLVPLLQVILNELVLIKGQIGS